MQMSAHPGESEVVRIQLDLHMDQNGSESFNILEYEDKATTQDHTSND